MWPGLTGSVRWGTFSKDHWSRAGAHWSDIILLHNSIHKKKKKNCSSCPTSLSLLIPRSGPGYFWGAVKGCFFSPHLTFPSLLASTVPHSPEVPQIAPGIFSHSRLLAPPSVLHGLVLEFMKPWPSSWVIASLPQGSKSHRTLEIPSVSPNQPSLLNSRHTYPIASLTSSPECIKKKFFLVVSSTPSVELEPMTSEMELCALPAEPARPLFM